MGYENHFTGAITITPPLTWAEIRNGPGVSDVSVRIVEETVDTDTGQNKVLTGDAIVPLPMGRYSGYSVTEDIQAIVDHYAPLGHHFAGYIEMQPDPGFEDQRPSRYVVRGGCVKQIQAQLVWPDDEADAATCPKCASSDIVTAYGTQGADEWLTRRCGNCRHSWQTPTGGRPDTGSSSDWRKQ